MQNLSAIFAYKLSDSAMSLKNKPVRIIALLLLFFSVTPAQAKKALLVGIEDYPHVAPLRGPAQDVNNIERLIMSSWGYQKGDIRKLVNSRATRQNILYELENWLGRSSDEELLFYYSGHGWHQKDKDGDEKDGKDETIAPYDTLPKPSERIVENMISDDEIAAVVKRLRAKKVIFIFDSCHSGTVSRGFSSQQQQSNNRLKITKSLDPFSISPQRTRGMAVKPSQAVRQEGGFIQGDGRSMIVWSAASSSQKAFIDIETKSGSVFTNRFIRGVQERKADYNRDGIVTNSEQLMYLQRESEAFCKRNPKACTLGLTPMLEISKELLGSNVIPEKTSKVSLQTGIDSMLPGENSAQVAVKVREGRQLRLGSPVTIECRSNRSGYLVLLDINAKGELLQIFPNRYSTPTANNFIAANSTVVIPGPDWGFNFEAQLPLGKNKLIAIFTEDQVKMNDLLGMHKDLEVITEPMAYLADMTKRLQSVWVKDDVNRPVRWSKAVFEYDIVR